MQRPHHFSVTLIALAVFAELVVNCTGTLRRNGSTCVSTPCGSIVTTSTSCHTQQPVSQRLTVRFDMRRVRQRTSTVSRLASNPPQTTVGGTPTSPHQLTQPLPCSPRCSSPFASTARDDAQVDLGASAARSGGRYFTTPGNGVTGLDGIGNDPVCGACWLSNSTGGT